MIVRIRASATAGSSMGDIWIRCGFLLWEVACYGCVDDDRWLVPNLRFSDELWAAWRNRKKRRGRGLHIDRLMLGWLIGYLGRRRHNRWFLLWDQGLLWWFYYLIGRLLLLLLLLDCEMLGVLWLPLRIPADGVQMHRWDVLTLAGIARAEAQRWRELLWWLYICIGIPIEVIIAIIY